MQVTNSNLKCILHLEGSITQHREDNRKLYVYGLSDV